MPPADAELKLVLGSAGASPSHQFGPDGPGDPSHDTAFAFRSAAR